MWRFYGYYGGLNVVGNLHNYGQFSDDSTFQLIPTWQNKSQALAFEDAIYTRLSHYSYELKNNNIRFLARLLQVALCPSSCTCCQGPLAHVPDYLYLDDITRNYHEQRQFPQNFRNCFARRPGVRVFVVLPSWRMVRQRFYDEQLYLARANPD